MFRSLPLPYFHAPVSADRKFAPEWKVTLQGLDRRTSKRAGQRVEDAVAVNKTEYLQGFESQSSKANSRAEGALKSPKIARFYTAFCVNIQVPGCKGDGPFPPGALSTPIEAIFNLFSLLPVKANP